MTIEPSSNIYVLKNCPLENTYDHTLWFDSVQQQTDYFMSLVKYRFPKVTYQRKDRGYMKLQVPVEDLYDCNYIMFQNEKFGDKWFYAFLSNQEYVGNGVSMVRYTIDPMQTWHFDYTINECFVEREHVADDTLGLHTVPEKLDIGEYEHHFLTEDERFSWKDNDFAVGVITVYDSYAAQNAKEAGAYGGVFSGLNILYFEADNSSDDPWSALVDWCSTVVDNNGEDGIIAMYMIPKSFITGKGSSVKSYEDSFDTRKAIQWTYTYGDGNESKKGPRNNKLYTHPFNLLVVDTMSGQNAEFRVEFLKDKTKFEYGLEGLFSAPPQVGFIPRNYNGVELDRTEMLTLDAFPQCAFVTDSYRAWVAMNYRTQNVAGAGNVAQGILGTVGSVLHGSPIGALTNIAGSATNILKQIAQWKTAETLPNRAHGELASSLPMANDTLGFRLFNMHVRPEYARIVDDYFDRYGYAVHTNKVPNRNVRPHWTFTKTVNCTITGNVPNDDMQKIIAVYNRGITFWKKGSEVGNYTLDNRVATSPDPTDHPDIPGVWYNQDRELRRNEMENNAVLVYDKLKSKGWSNNAIYAFLGSTQDMTTINPGLTTQNSQGDEAYGLIKWSPKSVLQEWCDANGYPVNSGNGQLVFIDTEYDRWWSEKPGYEITFPDWKKNTEKDLNWMTACFENDYLNHTDDPDRLSRVQGYAGSWKTWLVDHGYVKAGD